VVANSRSVNNTVSRLESCPVGRKKGKTQEGRKVRLDV